MKKIIAIFILLTFSVALFLGYSSLNVVSAQATNNNIIPNASFEQSIKSGKNVLPVNWVKGGYGNNIATYIYPVVGFNGQSAAKVVITKYTNGDRRWYFKEIAVKPNTQYVFSNYYLSNVNSEINVKYVLSNKKEKYVNLLKLPQTQNQWNRSQVSFITPPNVKTLTVFQLINKKGELSVDEFSLSEQTIVGGSSSESSSSGNSSSSSSSQSNSGSTNQPATQTPSATPVITPSLVPVPTATVFPTATQMPTTLPTDLPSPTETALPSPSATITASPSILPSQTPTPVPTDVPTASPSATITASPSATPTATPTASPSATPTPSVSSTPVPTTAPTVNPSPTPTVTPISNSGLILNGSVENSLDNLNPQNWSRGGWGTNTTAYTYPAESQDGSKGIKVEITSYTNGDAKWWFDEVNVTPGSTYTFSEYYKSNIQSNVTVQYKLSDGSYSYVWLADLPASTNWTQYVNTINVPSNAVSLTVFHSIAAVGYLTTDNYKLTESQTNKFSQGMISFNFDDGYLSVFQNALPILNNAGYKSTQYIIAETLGGGFDGYVNAAQVLAMQAQGHEIGAHSNTHADLTLLSQADLNNEVSGSKNALESAGVNLINSFAYPYGNYNSAVIQALINAGYEIGRGAYPDGENYKDTNKYELRVVDVQYLTPLATVQSWIDQAIANKSWVIFMFHQIDTSADQYSTTPARFQEIVNYAQSKNVLVVTNKQGASLMNP